MIASPLTIGSQRRNGFAVACAAILALFAMQSTSAGEQRGGVAIDRSQVVAPVLQSWRPAETVLSPQAIGRSVVDVTTPPPDAREMSAAPVNERMLESAKISAEALNEGRVSVLNASRGPVVVAPGNVDSLVRSNATMVERLPVGPRRTVLPARLPIELPSVEQRPAIELSYVISVPSDATPQSPRKRLKAYVFDSTGLTFDAGESAYKGEFLLVLANSEDAADAASLVDPVSVAIGAPGAQSIEPQPVLFTQLGHHERVSLSVASPPGDQFQIRVSANSLDGNADPVNLQVGRPRVIITPGARGAVGWGIGTLPINVQVTNIRTPASFRVVVQPEEGFISPNPIPVDSMGFGSATLRSASTGTYGVRVGNADVLADVVQIRYRPPYLFFALAVAGGLLGAFILGRGRKRWTKALAIGAASGVFGVTAYAAGFTSPIQKVIGSDTLAGMTEIVVLFLAAVVALTSVRIFLPKP